MVKYSCYLCSQKAKSTCRVCNKPICRLHNYGSRLQRSICQFCEKDVLRKGKIALYIDPPSHHFWGDQLFNSERVDYGGDQLMTPIVGIVLSKPMQKALIPSFSGNKITSHNKVSLGGDDFTIIKIKIYLN